MKLSQRIIEARDAAIEDQDAPYAYPNSPCFTHGDESGKVGGDEFYDQFTYKALRKYIAAVEGIEVSELGSVPWKFIYWVEGQVDGADNPRQWMMRHDGSDWDCEGWINAREYWDVEVQVSDVAK